MKTEIREEWIRRLRSGDYKQGQGRLTAVLNDGTTEHCCWGVLCEMGVEAGVVKPLAMNTGGGLKYSAYVAYGERMREGLPPVEVLEWSEMLQGYVESDYLPIKNRINNRVTLSEVNDSGTSFNQIADLIDYFYKEDDNEDLGRE